MLVHRSNEEGAEYLDYRNTVDKTSHEILFEIR